MGLSSVSNIITQKRAERTPGMAAVSGVYGRGVSGIPAPLKHIPGVVQGAAPPGYLELVDNVSFEAKSAEICNWLSATCDKGKGYFIPAECENGHRFAKELVCNKEWCSVCGEDGSIAHNRRFMRWLPKIRQFENMGYFVFTIPESSRGQYRAKRELAILGHKVQELLKSYGYCRGLRRWHFFGDKSTRYHPHLNCLVDGGFVSPQKLDVIKAAYTRLLGVDLADVNYHYRRSPGQMVHTLKYVARATFREYEWNIDMALELRGFRNMVVWGRGLWDGPPVWSLADLKGRVRDEVEGLDIQAIDALVNKVCPVCGKPIKWGEALPIGLLSIVEKRSLGAGYWRVLPNTHPPPGLPDDVKEKLHFMELIHRAEVQVAAEHDERERADETEYQSALWRDIIN